MSKEIKSEFFIDYDKPTDCLSHGNGFCGDWTKVDDNNKILRLTYVFGDIKVVMSGYKEYNHLLEYIALGVKGVTKIMLMGRDSEKTTIITFDLKTKKISKDIRYHGKEYGNQILSGWKNGELNTPETKVERIK